MARRIAAIWRSHRHYPLKAVALGLFTVDVKKWRIDAQLVARQTGQSFNVKRWSGDRIRANRRNIICSEDKNIPVVRLNKVVAAFIHKHLVASVDGTPSDNFTGMTKPTGKDVEILTKRVGRGVHEKALPLTHQSRKSKKEGYFLRHDLENLVVLARNDVDVIAPQNNEIHDLSQNIWWRLGARMTDNPV